MQDSEEHQDSEVLIKLTWWQYVLAVMLILLSMISKLTIFGVDFVGSPILAAIAVLILVWPLFHELPKRGGSAKIAGVVEYQINRAEESIENLDKRIEQIYAVRLQELQAAIDELRQPKNVTIQNSLEPEKIIPTETEAELTLMEAIDDYHKYDDDWRSRTEIDKRLVAEERRPSLHRLKQIYEQSPKNLKSETAMAVAVSLGIPHPSDDDVAAAEFLIELLNYPAERVRYRAALSMARRGRRHDTSPKARSKMIEAVRSREIREKKNPIVIKALQEASRDLTLSR